MVGVMPEGFQKRLVAVPTPSAQAGLPYEPHTV